MSLNQYEDDWERKKQFLIRSLFEDPPLDLTPIPEEDESFDSSPSHYRNLTCNPPVSPSRPDSPLPPLIIECEPNRHDEPEEFYKELEKKIMRVYRRLFVEGRSDYSSDEMSNTEFGQTDAAMERRSSEYRHGIQGSNKTEIIEGSGRKRAVSDTEGSGGSKRKKLKKNDVNAKPDTSSSEVLPRSTSNENEQEESDIRSSDDDSMDFVESDENDDSGTDGSENNGDSDSEGESNGRENNENKDDLEHKTGNNTADITECNGSNGTSEHDLEEDEDNEKTNKDALEDSSDGSDISKPGKIDTENYIKMDISGPKDTSVSVGPESNNETEEIQEGSTNTDEESELNDDESGASSDFRDHRIVTFQAEVHRDDEDEEVTREVFRPVDEVIDMDNGDEGPAVLKNNEVSDERNGSHYRSRKRRSEDSTVFEDAETQVTLDCSYVEGINQRIFKDLFVGVPKVFRLCSCVNHICQC